MKPLSLLQNNHEEVHQIIESERSKRTPKNSKRESQIINQPNRQVEPFSRNVRRGTFRKSTIKNQAAKKMQNPIQYFDQESYEEDLDEDIHYECDVALDEPIIGLRSSILTKSKKLFYYKSIKQMMEQNLESPLNQKFKNRLSKQLKNGDGQYFKNRNYIDVEELLEEYDTLYTRDPLKDNYNLSLKLVSGWDEIYQNHIHYVDKYPLLFIRKWIIFITSIFSLICYKITISKLFNFFMLFIVTINIVLYITKYYDTLYQQYQYLFDLQALVFFWIYIVEHSIKIIGLGLVPFLSEFWNSYDLINLIMYGLYIFNTLNFDFSPLRAMRILIQLGKLSTKLGIVLRALSEALKFMIEASLVVIIFCVFFANVGVHLFKGILKYYCFEVGTGIMEINGSNCGWADCQNGMQCWKSMYNPDVISNFDSFFFAFAQIIRTITMDNWTDLMYQTMYAMSPMTWLYFVFVIFIVGFFAFNLIIAVLKTQYSLIVSKFSEDQPEQQEKGEDNTLNLRFIKNYGLYDSIKTLQKVKLNTIKTFKTNIGQQSQNQSMSMKLNTPHGEQQNLVYRNDDDPQQEMKTKTIGTIGFAQLNKISKMVKRAKTIKQKEKQLRLVLSARQQRYLQKKNMEYIEDHTPWYIKYFSLKQILLPQRKFTVELRNMEQKIQDDPIGQKTVYLLNREDVLAWKLDIIYSEFNSNSQQDVINFRHRLIQKRYKLLEKQSQLQKLKIKQYYMIGIQNTNYDRSFIGNARSKSVSSLDSIISKNRQFFPTRRSSRVIEGFKEERRQSKRLLQKTLSSKKTMRTETEKRKKPNYFQKSSTATQSEYVEFPEWQEGQAYFEMNGVRWNYKALQILINRVNEDYLSFLENEDDNYEEYEEQEQLEYYYRFRKTEVEQGYIKKHNISIQDVQPIKTKRLISILKAFNKIEIKIWIRGFIGIILVIQTNLKYFLEFQLVTIFFDLITMINFFVLSADGYIDGIIVDEINSALTFCLLGEVVLKMAGQGTKEFTAQSNNILDTTILVISLLQYSIISLNPTWYQDFSSEINALRAFKSLMFYRVIKYNKFIVRIMRISQITFQSYLNLTFLMFFVIFMYAIIGLQFFVGRFDETQQLPQLHTFNSIGKAWMTIFNVITNDDAYGMARVATTSQDIWVGLLFYIAMIFALNYLIYGLVSAVLLDAFSSEIEKGNSDEEDKYKALELVGIKDKIDMDQEEDSLDTDEFWIYNTEEICTQQSKMSIASQKTLIKQVPETVKKLFAKERQRLVYFKDIECAESLYLFSYNSRFRRFCYRTSKSYLFKFVFNVIICSSVATMIINSFFNDAEPLHIFGFNSFYDYHLMAVNILIGIVYIIEIISYGMWMDEGAFCRDTWRFFDILYLLSYYLNFVNSSPFLDLSLYLIYLRPLMMINMFDSVQGIKSAMSLSLVQILNVIGVILLVFLIFDIFGMHLFGNKMGYCNDSMNFNVGIEECKQDHGDWIVYPYNFDNVANGLLTLFVAASFDGWGETMQICFNANSAQYGPSSFRNQWATYVFFILFIFIGAMFFMGFLTGVLFTEFLKYTKKLESKHLTSEQSQFLKISQLILKKTPNYSDAPKSFLRNLCYNIIFSSFYHFYFILVLSANTLVLCLFYQDANYTYMVQLNLAYQVITIMFASDSLLKIIAYGLRRYFATNWRVIEFTLSLIAVVDFVFDTYFKWFDKYLNSTLNDPLFTIYRLIFVLRDIRVLLIIQEFKGLSRLLRVLEFSLPLLLKILYIQIITQTTFALIAQQIFGHISQGNVIDDVYANFHNFINAALLMFKCTTGDDWKALMIDCTKLNPYCANDPAQCGSNWAYPFFLSYYLFSNIIIMNLFVLALVEQFENFFNSSSNAIQTYVENIDHFCNVWCKYTYETTGAKMHTRFIARFLLDLGEPLGALNGDNIWDAAKSASNFRIRANKAGYVDFNELLYETIRFAFKESVFKQGSIIGKKQMKQFDKQMKKKIKENCLDEDDEESLLLTSKAEKGDKYIKSSKKYSYQNFNILQEYLNVLITLKTWEKYTTNLLDRSKMGLEMYSENTSESEPSSNIVSQKGLKNKIVSLRSNPKLNTSFEDIVNQSNEIDKLQQYRVSVSLNQTQNMSIQQQLIVPQQSLVTFQNHIFEPSTKKCNESFQKQLSSNQESNTSKYNQGSNTKIQNQKSILKTKSKYNDKVFAQDKLIELFIPNNN